MGIAIFSPVGKQLRRSLHPLTVEDTAWLKYPLEWPQLWLAREARLPSCQSRFPPSPLLPVSCPLPPRLMPPRLELERSLPSWRREFCLQPPLSTSRRLAVSSPSETVSPVSMASRTSRPRRWLSSAPD